MATRFIKCTKCQKEYTASWEGPFKVTCKRCGTIIGSDTGKDIWYDVNNYNSYWDRQSSSSLNEVKYTSSTNVFHIIAVSAIVLIVLIAVVSISLSDDSTTESNANDQVEQMIDTASVDTTTINTGMKTQENRASLNADSNSYEQTVEVSPDAQNVSISSLIKSYEVLFDETFKPVASITLTNITGKDISQVFFRCDFAAAPMEDGSANRYIYNDGASFVNLSVNLKAGETQSGKIHIPEPGHKDFEKPNISIVKVRYSDGTVDEAN